MLYLLAAFAFGIGLSRYIPVPLPVLLGAAACALLLAALLRHATWICTAALLLGTLALGVLRSETVPPFPEWLLLRAPRITETSGTIVSYPSLGVDRIRFALQPDGLPGRLLVTWRCPGAPAGAVHYGDRVRVVGRTERPAPFNGFDYPAYLERQDVFATMTVEYNGLSAIGVRGGLFRVGDHIRQSFLGSLKERLTSEEFALAQSYVFGDRFALSDETQNAFARTGLMHILAVSGMHLTVLLAGAWWALRAFHVRPAVAYLVLSIGVLAAVWIIGPWISFVRSALLFAFIAAGSVLADLGFVLRSAVRPMNALAAAALVLLLVDPRTLFDVGFQLSVAATAGLIVFAPQPRPQAAPRPQRALRAGARSRLRMLERLQRATTSLFLVSLSAQAGAAPILALQFEKLQMWTAVSGLVAIPLSSLALWCGLVAIASSRFGLFATLTARFFGWTLQAFESSVVLASRLPGSALPANGRIGLWILGLVFFLAWAREVAGSSPLLDNAGPTPEVPELGGPEQAPVSSMASRRGVADNGRKRLTGRRRGPSLVRHDPHGEGMPDRTQSDPAAHAEASEAIDRVLRIVPRDLDRAGK